MRNFINNNKAFTLIEVVISIILASALMAFAIPRYNSYVERSKAEEGKNILKSVMEAQIAYKQQNGDYADDIANLGISVPPGRYFQAAFLEDRAPTIKEKDNKYTIKINVDGGLACAAFGANVRLCENLGLPLVFDNQWADPPPILPDCPGQFVATNCPGYIGINCCASDGMKWKGLCSNSCGNPGGPPGCFLSGTMITMGDGSQKPIENIQKGDMVLAFDEESGTMKPDKVTQVFMHPKEDRYLIVNGNLKVTPVHRVLSKGEWVHIGQLKVGDTMTDASGREVPISSIETKNEPVNVYNFEVNPLHTYVANGVIVHNRKLPASNERLHGM